MEINIHFFSGKLELEELILKLFKYLVNQSFKKKIRTEKRNSMLNVKVFIINNFELSCVNSSNITEDKNFLE